MNRILLPILVIGILLLNACGAPAPTPTPTPAPTPVPAPTSMTLKPKLIKEWSGTGNKTTEPFTITSQLWVIYWYNNPEIIQGRSTGHLQITVYSTGNPDSPKTVVNTTEMGASDLPPKKESSYNVSKTGQ